MNYRRVLVSAGRGGCGKSVCAAGLASALSARGRTLIADFDFSAPSLDFYLGLEDRAVFHLGDALRGTRPVGECCIPVPGWEDLLFLPGDFGGTPPPDTDTLSRLLRSAEEDTACDLLIADAPFETAKAVAELFDLVLLVTDGSPLSLRSAEMLASALAAGGAGDIRLLLNRYPGEGDKPDLRDIIDTAGLRLMGVLPDTPGFGDIPLPEYFRAAAGAPLFRIFSAIAARVAGEVSPLLVGRDE